MKTTDYLCTMLCFVPHGTDKNFLNTYMTLADGFVVPYSAARIDKGEDEKMYLYRVIVMKHMKENFKNDKISKMTVKVN